MTLIKSKCDLLEDKLKNNLPYTKIDYTYNKERDYCILDVKDKALGQVISKRARRFYPLNDSDILGTAGSTNSVQIIDNKISAETHISYISENNIILYTPDTGVIWSLKDKECYIDAIHIHDGGIPESHIHVSCNKIDDEQIIYMANIMKNANIISRKIAKLKI